MIPKIVIGMIVGRQHAEASNRTVIKAVVNGLNRGRASWTLMPKRTRKRWMRAAIKLHQMRGGK